MKSLIMFSVSMLNSHIHEKVGDQKLREINFVAVSLTVTIDSAFNFNYRGFVLKKHECSTSLRIYTV